MSPALTPSQTIGPFFHPGLLRDAGLNVLVRGQPAGERIRIEGTVYDGDGAPVPDALVEIWQADALGRYGGPAEEGAAAADSSFLGFGRSGTDADGRFFFETVKPGPVPGPEGTRQAPHVNLHVFARGLLDLVATRLYFEDEAANADDLVLRRVPAARRPTLLARRRTGPEGAVVYGFDVVLQGERETVFFAP